MCRCMLVTEIARRLLCSTISSRMLRQQTRTAAWCNDSQLASALNVERPLIDEQRLQPRKLSSWSELRNCCAPEINLHRMTTMMVMNE
jgi:hypothetical protein